MLIHKWKADSREFDTTDIRAGLRNLNDEVAVEINPSRNRGEVVHESVQEVISIAIQDHST